MDIEKFKACCNRHICNRHTIITDKCKTVEKQSRCHTKYLSKIEKDKQKKQEKTENSRQKQIKIDTHYQDFVNQVWMRDAGFIPEKKEFDKEEWKRYCSLWKILTEEDKKYLQSEHTLVLWLNRHIDVAHIEGKGSHREMKYDTENAILLGRGFHRRLDDLHDPFTGDPITRDVRRQWFDRITRKGI